MELNNYRTISNGKNTKSLDKRYCDCYLSRSEKKTFHTVNHKILITFIIIIMVFAKFIQLV